MKLKLVSTCRAAAALTFLLSGSNAYAGSAGAYDQHWGLSNSGATHVWFDLGGTDRDLTAASVLGPDGEMYLAGTVSDAQGRTRIGVAKLDPAGDLDETFSGDGQHTSLLLDVVATGIALSKDGARLFVSGYTTDDPLDHDAVVCQFSASTGATVAFAGVPVGQCLKPVFFSGVQDEARDIVVQPDGKFIIAGTLGFADAPTQTYAAFARFHASGAPDMGFGGLQGSNVAFVRDTTLYQRHNINAVAVTDDGQIVGAGTTMFNVGTDFDGLVVTLDADGSEAKPEATFDEDGGSDRDTIVNDLVIVPSPTPNGDDAAVVVGAVERSGGLFGGYIGKLFVNGAFDIDGFGTNGASTVKPVDVDLRFTHVARQASGQFIVLGVRADSGSDSDIQVRRFKADGVTDLTFGTGQASSLVDFESTGGNNVPAGLSVRENDSIFLAAHALNTNEDADFYAAKLTLDGIFSDGFEP